MEVATKEVKLAHGGGSGWRGAPSSSSNTPLKHGTTLRGTQKKKKMVALPRPNPPDQCWYEQLKEYTPHTVFIRLSRPQQAALYALCQLWPMELPEASSWRGQAVTHTAACQSTCADLCVVGCVHIVLCVVSSSTTIEQVVAEEDWAIVAFGEAFIKLSTRSPKGHSH